MDFANRAAVLAALVLVPMGATAGNWKIDKAGEFTAASTVDRAGNEFGVTCKNTGGSCAWVLKTKKECKEAGTFDVTILTDGMPTPSKVQCLPREGKEPAFFAILNFDQIAQLVPLSKTLAFQSDAQPLVNSGPFPVEDADGVLDKLAEAVK